MLDAGRVKVTRDAVHLENDGRTLVKTTLVLLLRLMKLATAAASGDLGRVLVALRSDGGNERLGRCAANNGRSANTIGNRNVHRGDALDICKALLDARRVKVTRDAVHLENDGFIEPPNVRVKHMNRAILHDGHSIRNGQAAKCDQSSDD